MINTNNSSGLKALSSHSPSDNNRINVTTDSPTQSRVRSTNNVEFQVRRGTTTTPTTPTTTNSREDIQTTTDGYVPEANPYQSTGFDTQLSANERISSSTRRNHNNSRGTNRKQQQQARATTYSEATTHSSPPLPRRLVSPLANGTNNNNESIGTVRAKSADYSRAATGIHVHRHQYQLDETPVASSSSLSAPHTYTTINNTTTSRLSRASSHNSGIFGSRSSAMYIDELCSTQQAGEKRELNALNTRFGNYLDRIKHLADVHDHLRRQVDDAYRKYTGHIEQQQQQQQQFTSDENKLTKYRHPSDAQLHSLRDRINEEVRAQTRVQIRLQRADYDMKFYQDKIKFFSTNDRTQTDKIRSMRQQLEANLQELDQLKKQYDRREQDLQVYKLQYNEYMNKIAQCTTEYDNVTFERMQNENLLYNLQEQLAFEREYQERCRNEYEYLEKFEQDFNQEFNKNELQNIVEQIRQDYREFNDVRIAELEILYKAKLETIREELNRQPENEQQSTDGSESNNKPREFRIVLDSAKKEYRSLIEQNQMLKDKLEQLEHDLRDIIDQHRQHYEMSDHEYKQLQSELPELESVTLRLRETTVSLWAEINTYRCLLLSLLTPENENSHQQLHIESSRTKTTKPKRSPPSPPPPPSQSADDYRPTKVIHRKESLTRSELVEKYTTSTSTTANGVHHPPPTVISTASHRTSNNKDEQQTSTAMHIGKHPMSPRTNNNNTEIYSRHHHHHQKHEHNSPSSKMVGSTSTTTVGTKAHGEQYRDETTGFIVHIEDGIVWVRI